MGFLPSPNLLGVCTEINVTRSTQSQMDAIKRDNSHKMCLAAESKRLCVRGREGGGSLTFIEAKLMEVNVWLALGTSEWLGR